MLLLPIAGIGALIGMMLLVYCLYNDDLPDTWREARPIHYVLPTAGSFVFRLEPDAVNFLRLAFVERRFEEALDFANSVRIVK